MSSRIGADSRSLRLHEDVAANRHQNRRFAPARQRRNPGVTQPDEETPPRTDRPFCGGEGIAPARAAGPAAGYQGRTPGSADRD